MVRMHSADAVASGPPGAFYIDTLENGQRTLVYKLPDGTHGMLYLRPLVEPVRHSWEWDGDPDRPTLYPLAHRPGGWRGWIRGGRMINCEEAEASEATCCTSNRWFPLEALSRGGDAADECA
jgi:hypothetical protein